jgi:hypothetical protein
MHVTCLWYGGSNYSAPDPDRDLERFDTLNDAKAAFWRRADFDPQYPCVDEDRCEMHVYLGEYTGNGPDRIIKMGRRGGVIVERA